MATDIERKFLVSGDDWKTGLDPAAHIRHGYLPVQGAATVRVCVTEHDATLSITSSGAGLERSEFEYPIPRSDAEALIQGFCVDPLIVKTRYQLEVDGLSWEIDEYEGANHGLVVASVRLYSPDASFTRPEWLGDEVSGDARYGNDQLVHLPFQDWPEADKARQ